MTLRVPIERLADSIPALRAAGVVAIECGCAHVAEPHDTVPVPPTVREGESSYEAEGPETERADGYKSDRIAAAYRWLESPDEPDEVREWLCAGALVGVR